MTHATRALQSHDLSGEGIKFESLFWSQKDTESLPGWGISSMPEPPPRQHKHERRHTPFRHPFILTRWIWKDDYDSQKIFWDLCEPSFMTFVLQVTKNPEKTSPRNLSRPRIEPVPAACQARMLSPASPRWIYTYIKNIKNYRFVIFEVLN